MTRELLPDALWVRVKDLLPVHPPQPKGGRPWKEDRLALRGIIFVLKVNIPWESLPAEVFGVCGMTCWRRLRDWAEAGVWERLQRLLEAELGGQELIDWKRAAIDSTSVPAKRGGLLTGPNPTDRGRPGSKHHLVTDGAGLPLAESLTPANTHDSREALPLVDEIPRVKSPRGASRRRPGKLHADKGYDYPRVRQGLRQRHIQPRIARRGVESSTRLGRHRWVVERTFAWLKFFRRLVIRYEVRDDIHFAFLQLACCLILVRRLS
ncbi:IS5 family transposase [Archangium primigenium]|uniref:IS5 family transposase n=1 Tax=[Archangium] primigenium TaxID=2792470 RepID=UPI00195D5580|nr:IS5 family transposase [Archangium primigenium]MBM7112903.1 IS5 family transposase [Archangium primigenium]MBM7118267.1 IS5 family transposase [Archangium primigenium]MBM7118369.1 IS5 family transposase [Archangium primigenium]